MQQAKRLATSTESSKFLLRRQLDVSSLPRSSHHSVESFITLITDEGDATNLNSIRSDQDGTFLFLFIFFFRDFFLSFFGLTNQRSKVNETRYARKLLFSRLLMFVTTFWTGQFCVVFSIIPGGIEFQ